MRGTRLFDGRGTCVQQGTRKRVRAGREQGEGRRGGRRGEGRGAPASPRASLSSPREESALRSSFFVVRGGARAARRLLAMEGAAREATHGESRAGREEGINRIRERGGGGLGLTCTWGAARGVDGPAGDLPGRTRLGVD